MTSDILQQQDKLNGSLDEVRLCIFGPKGAIEIHYYSPFAERIGEVFILLYVFYLAYSVAFGVILSLLFLFVCFLFVRLRISQRRMVRSA